MLYFLQLLSKIKVISVVLKLKFSIKLLHNIQVSFVYAAGFNLISQHAWCRLMRHQLSWVTGSKHYIYIDQMFWSSFVHYSYYATVSWTPSELSRDYDNIVQDWRWSSSETLVRKQVCGFSRQNILHLHHYLPLNRLPRHKSGVKALFFHTRRRLRG